MDLSKWIEPLEEVNAPALEWIDASHPAAALPDDCPPDTRIVIERCLGPEDATSQIGNLDVLGVYCLSLGQEREVFGLEAWTPDGAAPEGRDEMLVAVRVQADPASEEEGAEAIRNAQAAAPSPDFLVRDATRQWLETLEAESAGDGADFALWCPSRRLSSRGGAAPWTKEMPRLYAQRWDDEDLRPLLPLLWFDGPGADRFRWRYRTLTTELFRTNFLAPVAEWCQENARRLVGRFEPADSLLDQALDGWGPVMRLQEEVAAVAVSDPGSASASPLVVKQAVSVARQLGREPVLNEIFDGRDGRQTPLADFRAYAERSLALGASRLFLRSAAPSFRGRGKRVAGASAPGPAQPWAPEWGEFLEGLERLSELMEQGRRVCNILVLTPSDSILASACCALPPNLSGLAAREGKFNQKAKEIEKQFHQLIEALGRFQIDFDLGDEDTIERRGKAQNNTFWVGEGGEYTTLVIPPALSWRAGTIKKIRRFAHKGGCVIAARPIAALVDFEASDAIEELADEYPNVEIVERSGREVCFQVNRVEPRPFVIRATGADSGALSVHHRRTDTHEIFYLASLGREKLVEARIHLYADGAVRILDPWTPRIFLKDADEEKNAQTFHYNFHPGTATLFAVGGEADLTEPPHQRRPHATSSAPLGEVWDFERLDPNFLPLKDCRILVDGEPFSTDEGSRTTAPPVAHRGQPVEFARIALQEAFGNRDEAASTEEEPPAPLVTLIFAFESRMEPRDASLQLILEPNPGMEVLLNGETPPLANSEADEGEEAPREWILDPEFLRFDVQSLIQPGENRLELRFPYPREARGDSEAPAVEAPILAGDFAVSFNGKGRALLMDEPEILRNGSWTEQGYPYYGGRMKMRQDFYLEIEERKRYFLALDKPSGAAIKGRIGEHAPETLSYPPHRMEITRQARSDYNTFEIEIASTLHNLYGPVHTAPKQADAPKAPPEVYDALPYADRRLWNRKPRLLDFGPLGGAVLETFDPDAPPPPPPGEELEKDEEMTEEEAAPENLPKVEGEPVEEEIAEDEFDEDEDEDENEDKDEEENEFEDIDENDEDEDENERV